MQLILALLKCCVPLLFIWHPWPEQGGRAVLKQQLKEVSDRVGALENRMDKVETSQEYNDAYRRLRCEHSPGLTEVWSQFERKVFEAKDLKSKVCTAIETEVQAALRQDWWRHNSGYRLGIQGWWWMEKWLSVRATPKRKAET